MCVIRAVSLRPCPLWIFQNNILIPFFLPNLIFNSVISPSQLFQHSNIRCFFFVVVVFCFPPVSFTWLFCDILECILSGPRFYTPRDFFSLTWSQLEEPPLLMFFEKQRNSNSRESTMLLKAKLQKTTKQQFSSLKWTTQAYAWWAHFLFSFLSYSYKIPT